MISEDPSVGVVIRTRDRPVFLARALASVQAQRFRNWHVVLVNDGGEPGPVEALLEPEEDGAVIAASRVTVLHLDPGVGRSAAFNRGLAALDTDFVTCLDDDDTWDPAFMEALLAFWAEAAPSVPALGGVACGVTAMIEEIVPRGAGADIRVLGSEPLPRSFQRQDFLLRPLAYACYRHDLYPVQWMLQRDLAVKAGGFPEDFDVMEDRAFMNRFLTRHNVALLDRPLARHHRRRERTTDQTRSVMMNTLDNPSYDWRRYADLARATGRMGSGAAMQGLFADLLSEVNYETSAIWQKINGEATDLRSRLNAIEARLAPLPTEPKEDQSQPGAGHVLYDIWHAFSGQQIAYPIGPHTPFAKRFILSQGFTQPGTLFFLSEGAQRFEVQIPEIRDFAAIEFSLDGLADDVAALTWHLTLYAERGFLFETALSCWVQDADGARQHQFLESHVHSCPPGRMHAVTRRFERAHLDAGEGARLSVILPRQARNFHFCSTGFVLEAS